MELILASHLQFKTSPKLVEQANKVTNEHIKRVAQIFAKRGKSSIDDPAEVKALYKQVVAAFARTIGSPLYNVINYRRQLTGLLHPNGEMVSLAHPFVRDIFLFLIL
jgi:hypothetical protein